MKKLLFAALVVAMTLGMAGLAQAFTEGYVSFVLPTPFDGVDTTTGWSTNDLVNNLSYSSFTILGGKGTVTGYLADDLKNLSHRGTRGLGIRGGENDEVDYRPERAQEHLVITFLNPERVDYLEIRSLFNPETGDAEFANIHYYLGGSEIASETLWGSEALGSGIGKATTSPKLVVDKIVFQVDTQTALSDFAVAKLNLAIPEPTSMMLLGLGILGLFGIRRKS